MSFTLPLQLNRAAAPLVLVSGIALLAGCSSSGTASSSSATPTSASPSAPALSPSPTRSIHLTVGLELPSTWVSQTLTETGEGYGMTLTTTSDPDLFDGHFFHREADGAVTDQHVISLYVTSRSEIEVTWPDGTKQPGAIALEEDGSDLTEIDLAPGCVQFLAEGATTADCVVVPESDSNVIATPTPQEPPTLDEAMSYLCSVGVAELDDVTGPDSDSFSTSVLQAALTTLGFDPGAIDGRYGDQTRVATLDFQKDAGITVDGQVGPQTWSRLQNAACSLPEDPAQPAD